MAHVSADPPAGLSWVREEALLVVFPESHHSRSRARRLMVVVVDQPAFRAWSWI